MKARCLRISRAGRRRRCWPGDGARALLAEIEGEDLYEATLAQRKAMIELLVDLQAEQTDRIGDLSALGLPDWRAEALANAIESVAGRVASQLSPADQDDLASFLCAAFQPGWHNLRAAGCRTPWFTATSTRETSEAATAT
jgi:hypothetical protein